MSKKNEDGQATHKALSLENVCSANETLNPYFKRGISALKKSDRQCVEVPDTKLLSGSVALDDATKAQHPKENRWDYAIEYDGDAFFLEVHPGSTSEIECVIKKVQFVKEWLKANCPDFLNLPNKGSGARCFYWISSGGTDLRISPGSNQAKRMALHKIKNVGKIWSYSRLFK